MGFFERIVSVFRSEARDVTAAASELRDFLDHELGQREAELSLSPSEKIEQLQRQGAQTGAVLDSIADKIEERTDASGLGAQSRSGRRSRAQSPVATPGDRPVDPLNVPDRSAKMTDDAPGQPSQTEPRTTASKEGVQGVDHAAAAAAAVRKANFGLTDAEVRYRRAREAADDLLDELRGELADDTRDEPN